MPLEGGRLMFATRKILHGEEGQGLMEYSLILVLVSLVVVAALRMFGVTVNSAYVTIAGLP
jgi:Flp pilus assembly pilin Flp